AVGQGPQQPVDRALVQAAGRGELPQHQTLGARLAEDVQQHQGLVDAAHRAGRGGGGRGLGGRRRDGHRVFLLLCGPGGERSCRPHSPHPSLVVDDKISVSLYKILGRVPSPDLFASEPLGPGSRGRSGHRPSRRRPRLVLRSPVLPRRTTRMAIDRIAIYVTSPGRNLVTARFVCCMTRTCLSPHVSCLESAADPLFSPPDDVPGRHPALLISPLEPPAWPSTASTSTSPAPAPTS